MIRSAAVEEPYELEKRRLGGPPAPAMTECRVRSEVLAALPLEWPHDPSAEIRRAVLASGRKVVVLDDDPTGTQAAHDIPVLTSWPVELLEAELAGPFPGFFLLTNSRSLPSADARALNHAIAKNLLAASRRAGCGLAVVSRSDSTLRGHFPAEIEALNEVLGPMDGVVLAPFFEAGGRLTLGDVHYLVEGDRLVPVSETEFARDPSFGYRNSNLRDWVQERTEGRIRANAVASVPIETVRTGGPDAVADALSRLEQGRICLLNAVTGRDLDVFVLGLLRAEARGRRFLYRAAASFATTRAGILPRALLQQAEIGLPDSGGGLIVVGSHVPTTTAQWQCLLGRGGVSAVEFDVRGALSQASHDRAVDRAAADTNLALETGRDTVLYTSREPVTGRDAAETLALSRSVSDALVRVLDRVRVRPRFVLAKGGITSSAVLTQALGVRRALVLGQVLPGVPAWRLGAESRWPGLAYISFPGNLGGRGLLADVVEKLRPVAE